MDRWRRGRGDPVLAGRWPPGSGGPEQVGTARFAQYGRGRLDPETGLYEWYDIPQAAKPGKGKTIRWQDILTRWALVEADLHSEYGIDVDDRDLLRRRTWRWLRIRILGLLAADTRLSRALAPADNQGR